MMTLHRKRVLKKVRHDYIRKKDEDEETTLVDPTTKLLGDNQTYTLKACNCLVLVNRKIMMGLQFLNHQFYISQATMDDPFNPKSITLNVKVDENRGTIPWEYCVKRLESYGDLNLAVWAQQVKKYYESYPKLINNYFKILHSSNKDVQADLEKAKQRAQEAKQEIESKYPYRKLVMFSNKDSTDLIATSYNDLFLKEVGHTVESFASWTKQNGLPAYFEGDCSAHHHIAAKFLGGYNFDSGPVKAENEYSTPIIHKSGKKMPVLGQHTWVMEPVDEGVVISGYFIVKNKEDPSHFSEGSRSMALEKLDLVNLKRWKEESDMEVIQGNESDKHKILEEKKNLSGDCSK